LSLKEKTISGFTWSFIDVISGQVLVFIIGIILARLLTPSEFGLIGMTTIFMTLSESIIDSGFGQALVRKQNCTQKDFSTVFYFNLVVGIALATLLFVSAGSIAHFFNENHLKPVLRVVSLGLIIKSFSIIQSVILIKKIDFKIQTKISVIASLGSGMVGIFLAYRGFGVWSLVAKYLLNLTLISTLLWFFTSWRPIKQFSRDSFKELFSFGSKLLVSNLINRLYDNIYLLVIGKFFSSTELGYYTRAVQFKDLFAKKLTSVIQRVSYPTLASIQDDETRLKEYYRILIKSNMLIVFILSLGLISTAEPLIVFLIGEKWLPAVPFVRLLSIAGIFFPIQEINKNMLKVKGLSSTILRLEIVLKIISVPIIILGVFLGINYLVTGLILISFISYMAIGFYSGRTIEYHLSKQIGDIATSFIVCAFSALIAFLLLIPFKYSPGVTLLLQLTIYAILAIALFEIIRLHEYKVLKNILLDRVRVLFKRKKR